MTRLKDLAEEKEKRHKAWVVALLRRSPYLIAGMAIYRFIGLGFAEMQQWDEAIYALRTLAVWKFGALWDQAPFMLRGVYYAAHPPLYVWASTFFSVLFDFSLWVHRFPSAFAGALAVILMYRITLEFLSKPYALLCAAFLAFSPLVTFFSRQGQLDVLLMMLMLAALFESVKAIGTGRGLPILLSGVFLGLALMTKLMFALVIPAAVLITAMMVPREKTAVCVRLALLSSLVSLPLWLPWSVSFTGNHGSSNPLFLLSDAMPFGATLAGNEGTVKETGHGYYLNQLIVHLSFFFPLFALGLVRSLRREADSRLKFLSLFVLLALAAIWILRSSFEVYLIPLLPAALLLAVVTLHDARDWHADEQAWTVAASMACLVWSLTGWVRLAVKDALTHAGNLSVPPMSVWLLLLPFAGLMVLGLLFLRKAHREYWTVLFFTPRVPAMLLCVLAVSTMVRIWFLHPVEYRDGTLDVVAGLNDSRIRSVVFVGNGDNPQLTYHLAGEDIGWPPDRGRTFQRLEPRSMGVSAIVSNLERFAGKDTLAVIVEKDEIAQGLYRAPEDVLPGQHVILLDAPRYTLALIPRRPSSEVLPR